MKKGIRMKNTLKCLLSVVFAMVLLLTAVSSALALDYKQMSRQDGLSASAMWNEGSPDDYIETSLKVTKTDEGTDIYVSIYAYSGSIISVLTGYLHTTNEVFTMDGKLSRAALSSVVVDLYESFKVPEPVPEPKPLVVDTTPTRTITVEAEWTGIGELVRSSYRYQDKGGDFIGKYSSTSLRRQADVIGFLDDQDLGSAVYGEMVQFRNASMQMDK